MSPPTVMTAPARSPVPATTDLDARIDLPWRDPRDAFAPFAREPGALLLLSDGARGWTSRLYCGPAETFTGDGRAPFEAARAAAGQGWIAGLLAYEWGAALEPVPRAPARGQAAWPDVALGLYRACAVFDHAAGRLTLEGAPDAVDALAARLAQTPEEGAPPPAQPSGEAVVTPRLTEAEFAQDIARAIAHVRAGDVFQVNLSRGFDVSGVGAPWEVFRRLTAGSPAPFAAFFARPGGGAVLTNSPELFLEVEAKGTVRSRPIKGTRPRGGDPARDAALAAELERSDKDRAENLMIVDLVRNDLARVCAPGSVRVPALCALEGYTNVHHLVSTVEGFLAPGRDAFDALAAAFPPGSVTGAPKVRAMEIIAEREGEARGPYCGAIGFIAADGAAMFNVMIRTIAFAPDGTARFRSGGGITIGSDPADEVAETGHKAASILRALGAAP